MLPKPTSMRPQTDMNSSYGMMPHHKGVDFASATQTQQKFFTLANQNISRLEQTPDCFFFFFENNYDRFLQFQRAIKKNDKELIGFIELEFFNKKLEEFNFDITQEQIKDLQNFFMETGYLTLTCTDMLNYKKLFADYFPNVSQNEKQQLVNQEFLKFQKERAIMTQTGFFQTRKLQKSPLRTPRAETSNFNSKPRSPNSSVYYSKALPAIKLDPELQKLKLMIEPYWKTIQKQAKEQKLIPVAQLAQFV